jgi:hypothetical protein
MSTTIRLHQRTKLFTVYIHSIYAPSDSKDLRHALYFVLRITIFVALYYGFEFWARRTALIPFASYTRPVLVLELIQHLIRGVIPLAGFGLLAVISIGSRKTLLNQWSNLDYGKQLRFLVGTVAFVTAWAYATYDYNFYFDQGHYVDRLLLAGLMALMWWRPVFVVPFVLQLMMMIGQFDYPLSGQIYMWTAINLLLHALQLFAVFVILHIVIGIKNSADYIFLLCCLIGASYLRSGLGKAQLDWLSFPHINLLMLGGYSSGWLGFLPMESVVPVVKLLGNFSIPMMLYTLLIELGIIIFLAWRQLTMLFCLLLPAFHIGVFLVCGIFFWQWMILEMSLFLFLYRTRQQPLPIHTSWHIGLSIVLIGGGSIWFRTTNMSWYDTPVQYSYRYVAVTTSGNHYNLPASIFSPYADIFAFDYFDFLTHDTQLTGAYGVTGDLDVAHELLNASTADDVFAVEDAHPLDNYNDKQVKEFSSLISVFIGNLNHHRDQNISWWQVIQAPHYLWTLPRANEYWDRSELIERVVVYQYTSFFDGEIHSHIRQRIVLEVTIPIVK